MKKIGALLSSIILIIALIVPLSASAADASAHLSGPSSVAPGKTVSVVFSLRASDSYGVQATVSFDSSKLEYTGASKIIGGNWVLSTNKTNLVLEDTMASSPLNSSKSLARINFRVKSNASPSSTYKVSISGKASNGATFSSSYTGKVGQPAQSGGSSGGSTGGSSSSGSRRTTSKSTKLTTQPSTTVPTTTDNAPTKKSGNIKLANINVEGFMLSPAFNPDQKEYIVWLPYETKEIKLTASPEDPHSTVKVEGGKDLKSGQANIVKVICTAENGKTQTYKIKAMRAPINGVYETTAMSNNTKTGMPTWLIVIMCVGCALLGFILASISSKKRRNKEGKDYDSYNGLGINLFDDEEDDNRQPVQKSSNSSKFRGIAFNKSPKTEKDKSHIVKEQNQQRMYINSQDNKAESGLNNNVQRPVQPPVQKSVQPPVQKPVQPPVQRPVQSPVQKPVQPPVQRPVQPPVQKPVQPPVQKPVQPPVQKPVQPPVQKPVQPTIEKPVQPMGSVPSSKDKVGDKVNDIKPTSSASKQEFERPEEAEKMRLPYTAAGSTPTQQKVERHNNKQEKKMPRNPFEQSADD